MERAREMMAKVPCTKPRCDGPPSCILLHRPDTIAMSSNLTLAQIKEQKEKEGKGSRQPCKEDKGLTDNRFVKIAKKNSLQTFERECKYPNKRTTN